VLAVFHDKSYTAILDFGGDPAGARILGRYYDYLQQNPYEMLFVLNANRPLTNELQKAIDYLLAIEQGSRQKITGLVNNTHLCGETTVDDVLRGQDLAEKVSWETGLPIRFTAIEEKLVDELAGKINNQILPIKIFMKKPWED